MENIIESHIKKIIEDIPIYYINLNRATHRKEKLEKVLQDNNLIYKRIEAIDGNELDIEDYKSKYNFDKPNINIFEIACTFSHLKAIKQARDDDLDYVIIMEDDCNFEYIKYKKLPIKELMQKNVIWECIQLAITNSKRNFEIISESEDYLIKLRDNGAIAYLLNKKSIQKICTKHEHIGDLNVSEIVIFDNLNNFVTKPYFTYYYRDEELSYIRGKNKGAYTTQTLSKQWWDEYYRSNNENENENNNYNDTNTN